MDYSEYFKVARIESWLGWIFSFCFGSIFLGSPALWRIMSIFFAFSFATASIFILNQYFDRKGDNENKIKSNLPVASGRIAPRRALVLSLSLIILCLFIVFLVDMNLISLFLVYFALWTAYSGPLFRLKTVPVMDFIISGIGAGLIPFLIGAGSSYQQNIGISVILISAAPLMSLHSSGHILQALGDYEADRKARVQTFVVKYGRKSGVIVMGFLFLLTGLLTIIYAVFSSLPSSYFPLYFLLLPLCIPIAEPYMLTIKNPTTENIIDLQKVIRKSGIIMLVLVGAYVLVIKILGM